jgi:hypothetical protein
LPRFFAAALTVLVLAIALLLMNGYSKPPKTWWYPFITSIFSDYYTTGPFAMTSNTREDNPVWQELPALNKTQARMTYAMSRGEPQAKVAWLHAEAEWLDSPGQIGGAPDPNAVESAISKALVWAGYGYDRISRSDLIAASVKSEQLAVGAGRYRALLVNDLTLAAPELLASIISLAQRGIPVLWLGAMPERAPGWSDHERRDALVAERVATLLPLLVPVQAENFRDTLRTVGILPLLTPVDDSAIGFRSQRRQIVSGEIVLLFNEHPEPRSQGLVPEVSFQRALLLNPETGESVELHPGAQGELRVDIPARRTRLLYLEQLQEVGSGPVAPDNTALWEPLLWQDPPRSMHPYIRWWWPGNAVDTEELLAELDSIYRAGFGGVELQTLTIGMTQQHLREQEQTIYQVGSPAYLENVKAVMVEAKGLGMTVDLTLGSGWSSGGPFIEHFPEQQLLASSLDVTGPRMLDTLLPAASEPAYVTRTNWVIKNTIGLFDTQVKRRAVVAAKIDLETSPPTLTGLIDISDRVSGDSIRWQVPAGEHRIIALYQNNAAHNVAASAYVGALDKSLVVDHLNPGGAQEYIDKLGDPWLAGLAPYKPNAVFVDSFELIGELPWSSVFAETFESMHGYDITPYLPLVFKHMGESKYVNVMTPPEPAYQAPNEQAARIREDYELTREHLFQRGFLQPLKDWSAHRGVKLRVQAHGGYGDYLDSYQLADIPEAEGLFASGSYDFLKLASSAGHVAARRFISSESFISMTFDFDGLTIDDYYFLAGNAFAAGINRTICHGYAYHYQLP